MRLSGRYTLEKLVSALQGEFSCTYKMETEKKGTLTLTLFFVQLVIKHSGSSSSLSIFKLTYKDGAYTKKLIFKASGTAE